MATPGGLNISSAVFEQVRNRIPHDFQDLGEQSVKNITRPVRVYRVPLLEARETAEAAGPSATPAVPDKPSVAVLPFDNMSADPEQEARALYEQAVALDPNYAEAHAELARVCVQARNHGWSDSLERSLAEALAHAEKAVALDDCSLPEAHVNLGFICMWGKDHRRAVAEVEKGLALDPNHADGHM